MQLTEPQHIGIYVHLPWCVKKCPYCDFNSHALRVDLDEATYIQALLNDIAFEASRLNKPKRVSSIFIGGGTPSLFSSKAIETLIGGIQKHFSFAQDIEITLEANPGTADAKRFKDYSAAGVNRLSIGVQSFDDQQLKSLGRIHDSRQAVGAIEMALAADFLNLNLDLMYCLPEQTLKQAEHDVRQAIEFQPSHISAYHLTIEPNTLFAHQPPVLPDDEAGWDIAQTYWSLLKQAGYKRYEVSAYSQPGRQCKHNLNYWNFGDYLGIGAGAHGKISRNKVIYRSLKPKHPNHYMRAFASVPTDKNDYLKSVNRKEIPLEFMMNTLRLDDGFSMSQFESATGLDRSCILKPVAAAVQQKLLVEVDSMVKPTPRGKLFLDDLLQIFLPQTNQEVA